MRIAMVGTGSLSLVVGLQDLGQRYGPLTRSGWNKRGTNCQISNIAATPMPVRGEAGALVFVTEWAQFRALDLDRLKREMAKPIIIDLCNIYRPDDMARRGFTYESVGRPSVHHELIPAMVD
jgi:UDPglucose 6-dehydrogenase